MPGDFIFLAQAGQSAGYGLRIHLTADGFRLVGPSWMAPLIAGVATAERSSDTLVVERNWVEYMAEAAVTVARRGWDLDSPDQLASFGRSDRDAKYEPEDRLDPDHLRTRVRDDLANYVGGAPAIDPDLLIRLPGARFPTLVGASMEEPRLDIFGLVIEGLPADTDMRILRRLLGTEFDIIQLDLGDGELYAARLSRCDTYNRHYFLYALRHWYAFLDEGVPRLRRAFGLDHDADNGVTPSGEPIARPSVDLQTAQAWESYIDELTAEIEALVPGQRLVIEQPVAYPERSPGLVSVYAGSRGRCSATVHPDIAKSAENSMSDRLGGLVDVGWLDRHGHMAIDDASDIEELARHIVDDVLIATWDVVHPSFLTERRIVNEAGA